MSNTILNFIINNIFIISILQAYKFMDIKGFPITTIIISILLYGVLVLMNLKKFKIHISTEKIVLYVLIIYVLINFILNNNSQITSTMLFLFLSGFYFISYRTLTENKFNKIISVFINIMVVLSLYGIYQFFGRNFGVFYIDPYIPGKMVTGFNWTTEIIIGGEFFWRSNSIFIEPSVFSQYLGLTIMLVYNKIESKPSKHDFMKLGILILGFLSSFSGTGILVIIVISFFNIFNNKLKSKSIFIAIILGCLLFFITSSDGNLNYISEYFTQRFTELTSNAGSGGIRYIGTFELLFKSLKENLLIGSGMGTCSEIAIKLGNSKTNLVGNTIVRVGIELGLVGLILWMLFILIFILRNLNRTKNISYRIFLIYLGIQLMNSDMFLDPIYWSILYFLNFDFTKNSEDKMKNEK